MKNFERYEFKPGDLLMVEIVNNSLFLFKEPDINAPLIHMNKSFIAIVTENIDNIIIGDSDSTIFGMLINNQIYYDLYYDFCRYTKITKREGNVYYLFVSKL